MPIPITCPSCNGQFNAPDSAAGKKGKCPNCGGIIPIPFAAPAEEIYEAEDAAYSPFDDDDFNAPAPTGPVEGGDRKPCPMCGEMIAAKAVQCRFCGEVLDRSMRGVVGGSASDPGWRKVRGGLANIYYGIVIMLVTFVALIFIGMAIGMAAGARGGEPEVAGGLLVFVLIGGFIVLGAMISMIVGLFRCTAVPERSNARGFAIGAAICLLVNILFSMAGGATENQALNAFGSLLSMVGHILFLLFLGRAAKALGDLKVADSAGKLLIFFIIIFVMAIGIGVLAAAGAGVLAGLLGLVFAISALVAFVWYVNLIRSLMKAIDRKMGRR